MIEFDYSLDYKNILFQPRARRYANHKDGKKYDKNRNVKPQEPDALTSDKARSAKIFKYVRDVVTNDPIYKKMRKLWRENESE